MMTWLGTLLLVAVFVVAFKAVGLARGARRVMDTAGRSLAVIGDRRLSDDEKERVLRRQAGVLFALFAWMALGGAFALSMPLVVLWGLDLAGVFQRDAVLELALSWQFIALTCVVAAAVWWLRSRAAARRARAAGGDFENTYSAADRWLHRLAFDTVALQLTVAEMEDALFRKRIASVPVEGPVFIAGLPRAGTTLLLEMTAGLDEFVTHTYRRMPFVLTPLLWETLSRPFRKKAKSRERAHGDGMRVSADSPEALEEALWMAYWDEHYAEDRIRPWAGTEEPKPEFPEFFRNHIRKLVVAGRGLDGAGGSGSGGTSTGGAGTGAGRSNAAGEPIATRYISKNNLNIARVRWLLRALPDARFVIPFREPVQHAASLLKQHLNFLKLHQKDDFAKDYMKALGHFDFGANLRPVDFGGWVDQADKTSPESLGFWLRYWTIAYRDLAACAGRRVCFVDFEALCEKPAEGLARMAEFLGVRDRDGLLAQADRIRLPRAHCPDMAGLDPALLEEAREVYRVVVGLASGASAGAPAWGK